MLKLIYVTKINIKTLATQLDLLSSGIKLSMVLPSINIHYDLNYRTLNQLRKGEIDTDAIIGGPDEPTFSDAEISELLEQEKEVILTVVKLKVDKQRPGGASFSFLNNMIHDLSKDGTFKSVDKNNYNHNCLYLALQVGGLSDINLQELILTLKNRTIHKCDLSNACDTLEIHIELIALRSDGESRVEHYGKEFDEQYNLGLIKIHYFINDYTELTSYCLDNYSEVKDLSNYNTICRNKGKYYERDKTGKRFITAFQLFKILMTNVDALITPMELTDEVMNTQFYGKVDGYNTL